MKHFYPWSKVLIKIFFAAVLSACTATAAADIVNVELQPINTQTASEPIKTLQLATSIIYPTPIPQESEASPVPFQVCSPLENIPINDLQVHISNIYNPPPGGSDDPHQGVDLADFFGENRVAIEGKTVNAVLTGRVTAVIADRFPYGNAIIVETTFESLPPDWLAAFHIPAQPAEINPNPALTCPPLQAEMGSNSKPAALYLMYAHLQSTPTLQVGTPVQCGQPLGAIGSSGNALNPHLHLEVRLGRSDFQPGSMAHYDPSASEDEMRNYCLWRVSGLYSVIDPMTLFSVEPTTGL